MKKIFGIIIIIGLGLSSTLQAQSRKYISQFSHMQGYYNPALTGYEGSMFRGFVRDQWAGWEGAPRTYFGSVELDFGQMRGDSQGDILGKNAVGLSIMQDQYGAFNETELIMSYASRIQIGKQTNLRLGAGVSYRGIRLDGNNMTTEQSGDAVLSDYIGSFANMQIVDFNLGMAITNPNYYVSYGQHQLNKGSWISGDNFLEGLPSVHIVQAGYRNKLTDKLSVATNFMYRSQEDLPDNIELNFKVILLEKLWLGGGHRIDYANNFQIGFLFDKVRVGYIYEMPMVRSYLLPNTTHEFMMTYSIFGNKRGKIW
jgi:type IX secretion system PorP/SprF family membrane protein